MATATLGILHTPPFHLGPDLDETDDSEELCYEEEQTDDSDEEKDSDCRLLSLPAEIRNQIYHLLLTSESIPTLRTLIARKQLCQYSSPELPISPAVLSTCKQIYSEASPIFYSLNSFVASSTLLTRLPYLITPYKPINCPGVSKKIKRWELTVRLDCDAQFSEADTIDSFNGVDELAIDAKQSMYKGAGMGVLLLFKKVRGIKKATVTGSVERDFAEWLENCMMAPFGTICREFERSVDKIHFGNCAENYDAWTHGNR